MTRQQDHLRGARVPADAAGAGRLPGRRGWLQGALGVLGLLVLCRMPSSARGVPRQHAALESWLRHCGFAALGGRPALARQGARYLSAHPHERNRAVLTRLLAGDGILPPADALAAAIARDWRNHDIAVVDGWVLARTEARICALAHLSGAAPA